MNQEVDLEIRILMIARNSHDLQDHHRHEDGSCLDEHVPAEPGPEKNKNMYQQNQVLLKIIMIPELDIFFYLRGHSFPKKKRFHADKGECFNHHFRGWLRDQGSEPPGPHKEMDTLNPRWAKDRGRTRLLAAGTSCAPVAYLKRRWLSSKPRSWSGSLCWRRPFRSKEHIQTKPLDALGPRRRELALESRWSEGHYVGLSNLLHKGHVVCIVYILSSGNQAEKFLHTGHVRPGLIDPGLPEEELMINEKPRKRMRMKQPLESVKLRKVILTEDELVTMATTAAAQLPEAWDHDDARELVVALAERNFSEDLKLGFFRHGGTVGWMTGFEQYPDLSRLLAGLVLEVEPTAWTYNYVIPLHCPAEGGELWTELRLRPGDQVCGPISMRAGGGDKQVFGQEHPLRVGGCVRFHPRRLHEVMGRKGHRTMLTASTPQCLGKLTYRDETALGCSWFSSTTVSSTRGFLEEGPQAYMAHMELDEQQPHPPPDLREDHLPKEMMELEEDWDVHSEVDGGDVKLGGEFGLSMDDEDVRVAESRGRLHLYGQQILQGWR